MDPRTLEELVAAATLRREHEQEGAAMELEKLLKRANLPVSGQEQLDLKAAEVRVQQTQAHKSLLSRSMSTTGQLPISSQSNLLRDAFQYVYSLFPAMKDQPFKVFAEPITWLSSGNIVPNRETDWSGFRLSMPTSPEGGSDQKYFAVELMATTKGRAFFILTQLAKFHQTDTLPMSVIKHCFSSEYALRLELAEIIMRQELSQYCFPHGFFQVGVTTWFDHW